MDNRRIFGFLWDKISNRQDCVLVTILSVEGSSMRNPGAHMGVCADGSFAGSLSGGCIENAVVAEALLALKNGCPRVTRFGAGSPYMDIKLPCGGGLDIHFQPINAPKFIEQCAGAIAKRAPFALSLPITGDPIDCGDAAFLAGWRPITIGSGGAIVGHWPAPKLQVIGHGAATESLCRLAVSMDLDVRVLTPDAALAARLSDTVQDRVLLRTPQDIKSLESDPWTATIFLFHDHDWEGYLIREALAQPHFYIGAMGGRRAHSSRVQALSALGITSPAISSIKAPIGLFHSARDPDTLALSALAQIIQCYQEADFTLARHHG
ncbi:XdhC family protein [Sphingorhabdus arenilitoris]|uniref:XdhC family protein n=1 Tax=Sphingorhabdus arenilitoris TaxID=1490041 RepID=A0ABV8RIN8_9SPHN